MHHEPLRARRKEGRPGEYVQVGEVIVPNRDLTEAEWEGYPPDVRKLVRDCGLFDVLTDEEAREAKAAAEAPRVAVSAVAVAGDPEATATARGRPGGRRAGAGAEGQSQSQEGGER